MDNEAEFGLNVQTTFASQQVMLTLVSLDEHILPGLKSFAELLVACLDMAELWCHQLP